MISDHTIILLINIGFGLLSYIALLRFFVEWGHVPSSNPFVRAIVVICMPVVTPLAKLVGKYKNINYAAIIFALIIELARITILIWFLAHSYPDIGGLLVWGLVSVIQKICNILLYGTILYAIMTWIPLLIQSALGQCIGLIIHPIITFFRQFIPSFGMFDLSAMALVLAVYVIQMLLQPIAAHAIILAFA
jgi:YggT family protein